MNCNGFNRISIKTINGVIKFNLQRFIGKNNENATDYFKLTGQFDESYNTENFENLLYKYSPECSYKLVEEIAEDITGTKQVSDQGIHDLVIKRSLKLSNEMKQEYLPNINEKFPEINESVDIYDKGTEEIILQMDGILTKEQKPKRDKVKKDKRSFIGTNIAILQNKRGNFDYILIKI